VARERVLRVKTVGEDAGAKKAIHELGGAAGFADKQVGTLASRLSSHLGPAAGIAEKALNKVGASALESGGIMRTAVVGGAAAAGAAYVALAAKGVKAFVDTTAEIRKFKLVSGLTAQEASKLSYALKAVGVDADTGGRAFFQLSKTIENAPQKLAAFGVEVAKNKQGNTDLEGTLFNISDAYKALGSQQEKNALAAAAFGKAGKDLLPILARGKDGLKEFFDEAKRHGLVFDDNQLRQGREFNLAMKNLGEAAKGLEIRIGGGLVPTLAMLARTSGDVIDKLNAIPGGWGDRLLDPLGGIRLMADGLRPLASGLGLVHDKTKGWQDAEINLGPAVDDVTGEIIDQGAAAEKDAKALDKVIAASEALVGGTLSLADAVDAVQSATEDYTAKAAAAAEATRVYGARSLEATAANEELDDSTRGLLEALDSEARASADLQQKQAEARHETFSATQHADAYKGALNKLAADIGGPVGAALAGLASQVQGLEGVHNVGFRVEIDQALTAISTLGSALAQVPGLAPAGVALQVVAQVARQQQPVPQHVAPDRVISGHRARGGPVEPGKVYEVEEGGREFAMFGDRGVVLDHGMTEQLLGQPDASRQRAWQGETGPEIFIPTSKGAIASLY
jgi:hypothetical protein